MIAGEFDLSIGSILAASSMVLAVSVAKYNLPLLAGVLLALTLGLTIGFVNGVMVTKTGLPSFIVTLVTLFVLSGATLGIARILTGTTNINITKSGFLRELFAHSWHNFNISLFWWVLFGISSFWVLHRTTFGNWIFAIGGDVETARLNGVRVDTVKIRLYMFSGFSAALLGVIQTMEYSYADVTRGQAFVFNTIVASVVGGCLLTGGYGSILGVFLGSATYAIVNVGIFYTGWNTDWVQLFIGVLLLLAVLGNNLVRRFALTKP
jgi:simple sugar transport system permease protein